jgi:hypothetical protein
MKTVELTETMLSLTAASAETILRRSWMMATGTCPPSEYMRMVSEKMQAMQLSTLALMTGQGVAAVMHPWHHAARANARRLRGR